MSYTKHAWVTGETITAEKLNNIEDGIDGIDGGKQNAPVTAGTAGQVLGLDSNLDPVWVDQTGGGGGGMNIVNLSGTIISRVAAVNTYYVCGEISELYFVAPQTGATAIRFTSGSIPPALTFTGVTAWMYEFDPMEDVESNKIYEINIVNGLGVAGWA